MSLGKILEGPKLKVQPPQQSLGEFFFEVAEKNSEKICQIDGGINKTETYGSVKTRATRVAISLINKGITTNDVIIFCTGNTLDSVIPIMATFYIGAKVANIAPTLSPLQNRHLLSLVTPTIIFVEESSLGLIQESLKGTELKPEIIVYGKSDEYVTVEQLMRPQKGEDEFRPPKLDVNEIAIIYFSSGTTGLPKAICHSHHTFMLIGAVLDQYGMGQATMHFTSFFWITAMLMLLSSYFKGGYRAFCRTFDPQTILQTVEKYKIDAMFLAPVLLTKFLDFGRVDDYDTTSLRLLHVGGDVVRASLMEKAQRLFKHSNVMIIYGMTEIGTISSFYPESDQRFITTKLTSCGRPMPDTKIKIVDVSTRQVVGPNTKGEILTHFPGRMVGYYKLDQSDLCDHEGFLKTGDVGYYDEDGCLYVVERIKEMFKYQSWHIVPSTIEAVLHDHEAVAEAAVFGIPAGDDGEIPAACVVLRKPATEKEIFDFVADRLSDLEKLRGGVFIVDQLAKTPTGKLARRVVRDTILQKLNK